MTGKFGLLLALGFFAGTTPKLSVMMFGDGAGKIFSLLMALGIIAYSVWLYCGRGECVALNEPIQYEK